MKELKINPPKIKNKVLISNDRYSNYKNINTTFGETCRLPVYSEKFIEIIDYYLNDNILTIVVNSKNIRGLILYVNNEKYGESAINDWEISTYHKFSFPLDNKFIITENNDIADSTGWDSDFKFNVVEFDGMIYFVVDDDYIFEMFIYLKDKYTPFRSADYQLNIG